MAVSTQTLVDVKAKYWSSIPVKHNSALPFHFYLLQSAFFCWHRHPSSQKPTLGQHLCFPVPTHCLWLGILPIWSKAKVGSYSFIVCWYIGWLAGVQIRVMISARHIRIISLYRGLLNPLFFAAIYPAEPIANGMSVSLVFATSMLRRDFFLWHWAPIRTIVCYYFFFMFTHTNLPVGKSPRIFVLGGRACCNKNCGGRNTFWAAR